MTESKHTPGPWSWHEGEESLIGLTGVHIIRDWGTYEGLKINNWDRVTEAQAEANKRLIAAAPEMLKALKAMRAECMGFVPQCAAQVDAAIAKAEGQP